MPPDEDDPGKGDTITLDMVHNALSLVVYERPGFAESAQPCDWTKLCGEQGCKFPRYFRGEPAGLTSYLLLELGYPAAMLKDLDCEYECGEVLHPGVKIQNSRHPALLRLDDKALALLGWIQQRQTSGMTWNELHLAAFAPYRFVGPFDRKRRPWLY